jgi:hypothetical protein
MRVFHVLFLLLGLLAVSAANRRERQLFQVVNQHPHDVRDMSFYLKTIHKRGRLWVVEPKEGIPKRILEKLRPITGREKSYLWERQRHHQAQLTPEDLIISSLISGISPQIIRQDVEILSSFKTRKAGTEENYQALQLVKKRLLKSNLTIQEICYKPKVCSLIAERKGTSRTQDVLMVMSHIDSVGHDFAGADDNASGVAVLLEIVRIMDDYKNKKTLRFFVSNGEEQGMMGARHYVTDLKRKGEIEKIKFALNMDMIAYNSNNIVEFETDPSFEQEAKWLANIASSYTSLTAKVTLGAWGSDHLPFVNSGIPAIMTIEDWDTMTPCYHAACDVPEGLNYDYAAEVGKLNAAAILKRDLF